MDTQALWVIEIVLLIIFAVVGISTYNKKGKGLSEKEFYAQHPLLLLLLVIIAVIGFILEMRTKH